MECINLQEGLARVRNNKKLYKRMLAMYLANENFSVLEDALTARDYAKAADAAHGIKGMTGNLSLTAVFQASDRLTEELRKGEPDEETLAAYREACAETKLAVEKAMSELD